MHLQEGMSHEISSQIQSIIDGCALSAKVERYNSLIRSKVLEKLESNAAVSAPPVVYVAEPPTIPPSEYPPQIYTAPRQYPAQPPPEGYQPPPGYAQDYHPSYSPK